MATNKPGLGSRNSLSLLLSNVNTTVGANTSPSEENCSKLIMMPLNALQPGKYQPRKAINTEALQELAESIKAQGIIQPIVVRASGKGHEIIAGERRWRAAQLAGLSQVPVIIQDVPDEAAMAMALIENIQRQDLSALEEATALQRLIDEFEMTHQQVAEAVGKSRVTVTNLLRLLTLNADVKEMLAMNKIDLGHAKVLLGLHGEEQSRLARIVALKGLTVRETEALIKRSQHPYPIEQKTEAVINPDIQALTGRLSDKLETKINIQHKASGKGSIVIPYKNLTEVERLIQRIEKII